MRIIRRSAAAFLLILTLLVNSGCETPKLGRVNGSTASDGAAQAGDGTGADAAGGNDRETTSEPEGGPNSVGDLDEDAGIEAVFVDEIPTPETYESIPIVSVDFVADASRTVSVECTPRNGGTLTVTDEQGTAWTLEIPPFSLSETVTISMTPVSDITVDGKPSFARGGVKLEPDGLTFLMPALMKVTPQDASVEPVLLSGTADGDDLQPLLSGEAASGFDIDHFSSLVFTDRGTLREQPTIEGLQKRVNESMKKSVELAKLYLANHRNEIEMPRPPAWPLGCETEEAQTARDKALQEFLWNGMQPEADLARFLLRDLKWQSLLGDFDMTETEAHALLVKLAKRQMKKSELLMKAYEGQPDYLMPVASFLLKSARELNFLTVGTGGLDFVPLAEKLRAWVYKSVKPLLTELREQHDYRLMKVLVQIAVWQQHLGGTMDASQRILDDLEKAMRFELQLTVHYVTADGDMSLFCYFPLKANETLSVMSGSNTPGFSYASNVEGSTFTASPVSTNVMVTEFNPCKGTGRFVLDRFWANAETLVSEDDSFDMQVSKRWWEFCYQEYKTEIGEDGLPGMTESTVYAFPLEVINGQAIAAQGSVDGKNNSGGRMKVTFEYKLVHMPGD